MIRIHDLALLPDQDPAQLLSQAARLLKVQETSIKSMQIVRRSVDARKKPDIRIIYTVDVEVQGSQEKVLRRCGRRNVSKVGDMPYCVHRVEKTPLLRPVVVGFGPAGMFAALVLAMAGLCPLVLERGEDALSRHARVEEFFRTGALCTRSNVQFGEGGAGTFSDGKLNTGIHNPRIRWVLEQFVEAGAREDILMDAKPHVGTDVLLTVVQNLRKKIVSLGGEVRFCAQVTGIQTEQGALTWLELADGQRVPCTQAVLAIGHSARDTFEMLLENGVPMEPKPFAMGVRIEHLQAEIDQTQYGGRTSDLPPADYKLVAHLEDRTVYTFCMCPGGYVVAAASEEGGLVTNGMSNADRDGENANAALLVTVNPADFPQQGPLSGMYWQRQLEQAAYRTGGGDYRAPAQKLGDFLAHRASQAPGRVAPTYRPGVRWCDLHECMPPLLTEPLEQSIAQLDRKLPGFGDPDAVLTALETRSSSPVRILRGEDRQSVLRGLYPTGEGAGYAGGIMSAAIDGMMTAEAIIREMEMEYGKQI